MMKPTRDGDQYLTTFKNNGRWWPELARKRRQPQYQVQYTRLSLGLIALNAMSGPLYAHELLGGDALVNPPQLSADRDNAKLNFLVRQARRNHVDEGKIKAAQSIYIDNYKWRKTELKVCFWNGSEEQQREVMRIAKVWTDAVPIMSFNYLDGSKVRLCSLDALKTSTQVQDIRISLTTQDPRALYSAEDFQMREGDWAHYGNSVTRDARYPTTMNLVGAMKMRGIPNLTSAYLFNIRHEFGHAMSLVHEHQSSICKNAFNIPLIAKSQRWSEAVAESQVGELKDSSNTYAIIGGYDIESIMQYNFDPSWYMPDKGGWHNPCKRADEVEDLSPLDKIVVAELYEPTLNEVPERQALIENARRRASQQLAAVTGTDTAPPAAASLQSISVEKALEEFTKGLGKPSRITIQVYPHKADEKIVLKAISNLGYPLSDKGGHTIRTVSNNTTAMLRSDPTNAILFTSDVSDQDVRYVALSLLRAGIEVKSLQPYFPSKQNNFAARSNLLQIGASVYNREREPLSVNDIISLPLPMFGKKRQ